MPLVRVPLSSAESAASRPTSSRKTPHERISPKRGRVIRCLYEWCSLPLPYLFSRARECTNIGYLVLNDITLQKRSERRKTWEKGLDNSGNIEGISICG